MNDGRKTVYLGRIAEEMMAEANRLCVPVSAVAQRAWRIARDRLSKIHDPVERANMAGENIAKRRRKLR